MVDAEVISSVAKELRTAEEQHRAIAPIVDRFGELSDAGAQQIIVRMPDVTCLDAIGFVGSDVIPALRGLG